MIEAGSLWLAANRYFGILNPENPINPETQETPENPANPAVQLNTERLKLIDDVSRLLLELKNQFPEIAQNLSKAMVYVAVNQENIPIKNLMNLLSEIQQNLEVLENKPAPAQKLEATEAIKNLVNEAVKILQPNTETPPENKLIIALSQNDFASANTAIKNIVEQAKQQMQQPAQVQNPKIENFRIIFNALQELKELGVPKELQKAPLKELEAIALQKNGIEVPKEAIKNIPITFSEKPVFATVSLKIDFANTAEPVRLQITPLPPEQPSPPREQPQEPQQQKQEQKQPVQAQPVQKIAQPQAFEIILPKEFPLQKILANIPLPQPQSASALAQPPVAAPSQQPPLQALPQIIPQIIQQQPLPQPPLSQPAPQIIVPPQQPSSPSPPPLSQPLPQIIPLSSPPPVEQEPKPPQKIELALSLYQITPKEQPSPAPAEREPKPQFILQPWPASVVIPKEERNFWLKTELPLTPQILNIREAIISTGKLPENPEIVRSFANAVHEISLQTEYGASVSKEQANLLWRFIQASPNPIEPQATKQLPEQITRTLLKYQPLGNYEGDLFKSLPEPIKRELAQELPQGKIWQPETLQKAVEKVLEKYIEQPPAGTANLNEHTGKAHEEVRSVLQNFKEQIQWTRIDQDTRPQNDKENIFYFMHNGELQKGRVKIKDERKGGSKKHQDAPISFTIKTKVKNLGEVQADLTLSKNRLNIRMQDEAGVAENAVKEERETLAKELADIGIVLGELLYGKTPKIQHLPVAKKEKSNSGLDVMA